MLFISWISRGGPVNLHTDALSLPAHSAGLHSSTFHLHVLTSSVTSSSLCWPVCSTVSKRSLEGLEVSCFSLNFRSFCTFCSSESLDIMCGHCNHWIYARKQSHWKSSRQARACIGCVLSLPLSDKISWTASTHSFDSYPLANPAAGPLPKAPHISDPCCVLAQCVGTAGGGQRISGSDILRCTT